MILRPDPDLGLLLWGGRRAPQQRVLLCEHRADHLARPRNDRLGISRRLISIAQLGGLAALTALAKPRDGELGEFPRRAWGVCRAW